MYIPSRYRELNPETIAGFLRANDFVTLVSFDGQGPLATHLLVDFQERDDGSLALNGHMARANPQWRTWAAPAQVLAIFAGPHTYISPRWYNHTNVPTWNYMAVHVYGLPRVITETDELVSMLKRFDGRLGRRDGSTWSDSAGIHPCPRPWRRARTRFR